MTATPDPRPGAVSYPLCGPDEDPTGLLTITELDAASQQLQVDVMAACQPGHPRRSASLALVAWQLARRQDAKVQLAAFRALTIGQLSELLWPAPDPDATSSTTATTPVDGAPELDQLDPDAALDQLQVDQDPLAAAVADRPTAPTPAP